MFIQWMTAFILFLLTVQRAVAPDCSYRYIAQPASIFTCNPYPLNELRLTCSVDYFSDVTSIRVRWFASLEINQSIPMRIDLASQSPGDKYAVTAISGISFDPNTSRSIVSFSTDFTISNLGDEDTGRYWCQIILSNGTELERSEVLTLGSESTYTSDPVCRNSGGPSLRGVRCAMILPEEPVTTNEPSPDTNHTSDHNTSLTTTMDNMSSQPSDRTQFLATVIAAPLGAAVLVLLVCVAVGVCVCISCVRYYKKNGRKSPDSKVQGNGSTTNIGSRPLPSAPDRDSSYRYQRGAAYIQAHESYELERNPAYGRQNLDNSYLSIFETVSPNNGAGANLHGDGHRSDVHHGDHEYALADLVTSDEPYYVYVN